VGQPGIFKQGVVTMTDVQAVRTLIGDQGAASFTDAEIQLFLDSTGETFPGAGYFYAASMALNALAGKIGTNLKEIRLGDFMDSSGKNQVTALRAQADAWYQLYLDEPAWAVIENNVSDFNALVIIRNFVLRTNP
jgi:hypothetical protein